MSTNTLLWFFAVITLLKQKNDNRVTTEYLWEEQYRVFHKYPETLPLLYDTTWLSRVRNGMYGTGMERDGDRINKTLRFCRRYIDVVFILSSLMSTCELDRFVIQTSYIKVVKSCSAPFVDRQEQTDRRTWTNEQTDPQLWSSCSFLSATHPEEKVYLSSLTFLYGTLRNFLKTLKSSTIDSCFFDKSLDILYTWWQVPVFHRLLKKDPPEASK